MINTLAQAMQAAVFDNKIPLLDLFGEDVNARVLLGVIRGSTGALETCLAARCVCARSGVA